MSSLTEGAKQILRRWAAHAGQQGWRPAQQHSRKRTAVDAIDDMKKNHRFRGVPLSALTG